MNKALRFLLPDWARPENPILQYELAHAKQPASRRRRFVQLLVIALMLGVPGHLYATHIHDAPAGSISDLAWRSLYFPTLLVQVATAVTALSLGIGSVGQERSRQTWDHLRATAVGASLTLRTRWIAILYRLRAPLLAILLVRLILLIAMLYDLAAFGGLYVEMLSRNATPTLADWRIGWLVIALLMTVSLLLPFTMIAVSGGIGLLISVAVKDRVYIVMAQVTLVLAQAALAVGTHLAVSQVLRGSLRLSDGALFALFLGYSGLGDWGLLFAQLGSLGEIWALVPYGIFIGVGLMAWMLLQAAAADGILWLAGRLAESRE